MSYSFVTFHIRDVQGRVNRFVTVDKYVLATPYRRETGMHEQKAVLLGYDRLCVLVVTVPGYRSEIN
jgi:hypothetical protein